MSHWLFESEWLICLVEVVELAQQDDGPSEESLTKQGGVIKMGVSLLPLHKENGILICMYSTMQVN